MMTARDYQEAALASLKGPQATKSDLIVMATGTGKTIVFAEYLNRELRPGRRGLVLAHRDELIDQAVDKIGVMAPALVIEREKAEARAARSPGFFTSADARGVVVASVQTLRGNRLQEWPRDAFDHIIIDEAHHATAQSYLDVIAHFNTARLIGVTATPSRTDGKPLGDVFERIAMDFGIREGIGQGWLVPVNVRVVKSSVDLSGVKQSAGDYALGELQTAVNVEERNALIIAAIQKFSAGRRTIVFAAGVEHAMEIAHLLTDVGIPSEAIWGAMEKDHRRAVIARFRAGETRVLTNYAIATEGFDEPSTGCVVLARPTQSELLLTQMLGRGTRPLADIANAFDPTDPKARQAAIAGSAKPHLIIIDVQDVSHRITATAATLAGLPRGFDSEGGDIFKAAALADKLDPRLIARCKDLAALHEMLAKVAAGMDVAEIDLLAATSVDPAVAAFSKLLWSSTAPDTFAIRVNGNTYALAPTTLGTFTLSSQDHKSWAWSQVTSGLPDVKTAFLAADDFIARTHPDKMNLLDSTAKWRKDGPSPKQVEWLVKLGIFKAGELPPTLTKGQASQLMDEAFAKKGPRRAKPAYGGRR